MPRSRRARAAGAAAFAIFAACVPPKPVEAPAPTRALPRVLVEVQAAAAAGRYSEADFRLETFAQEFPGSGEASEALYWRALLKLDPANREASVRDALALLDAYLKAEGAHPHQAEVATLSRMAAQRESLTRDLEAAREAATKAAAAVPPPVVVPKPDEDVAKLRDSLARTTAELERIKRRLTAPRP
jgi:hypothetical protein